MGPFLFRLEHPWRVFLVTSSPASRNTSSSAAAAEADYQFFRDAFVEAAAKHGLAIHAYVWMTNHIHLLATPEFDDSIGKTFQSVGRRYVQYFNYTYKRSGTLWEGRYRATVVDSGERFRAEIEALGQRQAASKGVGRPRKRK